ncbi:MAG: hypothetical protein ABSE73_30665 [Planctomycetota bacterium]
MAEEGTKGVSARGAFFIGLVLGAGLVLVFAVLQHKGFMKEIRDLQVRMEVIEKDRVHTLGDLTAEKLKNASK